MAVLSLLQVAVPLMFCLVTRGVNGINRFQNPGEVASNNNVIVIDDPLAEALVDDDDTGNICTSGRSGCVNATAGQLALNDLRDDGAWASFHFNFDPTFSEMDYEIFVGGDDDHVDGANVVGAAIKCGVAGQYEVNVTHVTLVEFPYSHVADFGDDLEDIITYYIDNSDLEANAVCGGMNITNLASLYHVMTQGLTYVLVGTTFKTSSILNGFRNLPVGPVPTTTRRGLWAKTVKDIPAHAKTPSAAYLYDYEKNAKKTPYFLRGQIFLDE